MKRDDEAISSMNILMNQIRESNCAPFSADEERAIFAEYIKTKDPELKNEIIMHNLGLVVSFANELKKKFVNTTFEDLVGDGFLGLIQAVDKYDPNRKTKFSTCAYYWIAQSIRRGYNNCSSLVRIPEHRHARYAKYLSFRNKFCLDNGIEPTFNDYVDNGFTDEDELQGFVKYMAMLNFESLNRVLLTDSDEETTLEHFIRDPKAEADYLQIEKNDLKQIMLDILNEYAQNYKSANIRERDTDILKRRFGIDDHEIETLEDIGNDYGLTRERVRQIESKFTKYLRLEKNKRRLIDYLEV